MAGDDNDRPLVAVAGAGGFVGTHLRRELADLCRFRALTRSANVARSEAGDPATEWRRCDLYSLPKVTEAVRGCRVGVYLVHSMAPSSRLTQGRFEDTDLLLADNFIRAAEQVGMEHVVYLSGLIPADREHLSPHLRSRLEVEAVLRGRGVPVTVLRAGLIVGPGGSSFSMLVNLVRRLPVMILPAWTRSTTHSIDVRNVCDAFRLCLRDADLVGGTYDLAGHRPMPYDEMVREAAGLLGKGHRGVRIPFNCFTLSRLWVSLFGAAPRALVGPLQESLRHDLVARPNPLLDRLGDRMIPFEESFKRAIDPAGRPLPSPREDTRASDAREIRRERRVRSVQRMPRPLGWNAHQVARDYGDWLRRRFGGLIRAEHTAEGVVRFRAPGRVTLLELTPSPYTGSDVRRCAFYISGGALVRPVDPPGRYEFRLFPEIDCMIASVHDYAPTLPWWLYARSQALVHLWVMRAFARHLRRRNASVSAP